MREKKTKESVAIEPELKTLKEHQGENRNEGIVEAQTRAEEIKAQKEGERIAAVYSEHDKELGVIKKTETVEVEIKEADNQFKRLENNLENLSSEDCLLGMGNIAQYKDELLKLVPDVGTESNINTETLKRVIRITKYLSGLHTRLGERRETLLGEEAKKKSEESSYRENLNRMPYDRKLHPFLKE